MYDCEGADYKFMEALSEKIGVHSDGIDFVERVLVKSQSTQPIPVRLRYSRESVKYELLKAARKLKDIAEYKNISICLDLSFEDRESDKKLVYERNKLNRELTPSSDFRYGIRKGQIVKLKRDDSRI